jgi:hypothetical protein
MSLDSCSRTTWNFIHLKFILIRINILSSSVGQTSVDRSKGKQTSPNRRKLRISSAEWLRTALLTLVARVHPVGPELHLDVVVHVDGVRQGLWTAATNGPIVHPWYIEYGQPWRNDTDRGKPRNSDKNLSQCHSVHHKSHMDWPGCESGSPR